MTNYKCVGFTLVPFDETEADILESLLCDYGYDSFEKTENGILAYIIAESFDENNVQKAIDIYPFKSQLTWNVTDIDGADWNEVWEQESFKPLTFKHNCIVHSSTDSPDSSYEYDIILNPRMSFGSGHHETTRMMIEEILDSDLHGKKVLDMGTGTGVLAILAAKKGADDIMAVEIDETAYLNAKDNAEVNNVDSIVSVCKGDASLIADTVSHFDLLLANINRNIILNDFALYAKCVNEHGKMYLSGFYAEDVQKIVDKATDFSFHLVKHKHINEWQMLVLEKSK